MVCNQNNELRASVENWSTIQCPLSCGLYVDVWACQPVWCMDHLPIAGIDTEHVVIQGKLWEKTTFKLLNTMNSSKKRHCGRNDIASDQIRGAELCQDLYCPQCTTISSLSVFIGWCVLRNSYGPELDQTTNHQTRMLETRLKLGASNCEGTVHWTKPNWLTPLHNSFFIWSVSSKSWPGKSWINPYGRVYNLMGKSLSWSEKAVRV